MSDEQKSPLVLHAKRELALIKHDEDGMQDLVDQCVLELIEVFSRQGHGGFSAPYVLGVFNRLAKFEPWTPLTGADDEWNEVGYGTWQNNRHSAVFKDDSGAHFTEGYVFHDLCADGTHGIGYISYYSSVPVTFPCADLKTKHLYQKQGTVIPDRKITQEEFLEFFEERR
ncbi:MAG: hypothetical protein LBK60_10530 [Verrucomicrobiales bacterium]|jgi:hypothetical protein|nr:hypothetical protein [Verrucomicrobiales bacterium]